MDTEQPKTSNLVDTTDCLEAVGVFRFWKNVLFFVLLVGLLLQLGAFLAANFRLVKIEAKAGAAPPAAVAAQQDKAPETIVSAAAQVTIKILEAAKQIAGDANAPAKPTAAQPQQAALPGPSAPAEEPQLQLRPKFQHLAFGIRLLNFVLIPSAVLYCLTILFALKVSLLGRLGGINHISRALFISIFFVIFLLPWQLLFRPVFAGVIFTPGELLDACTADKGILAMVSFYLRFIGYWLFVLLMLFSAQIRSIRWTRATLRRLEVI